MKGKDINEMEFPDFEDDNIKITKLRMYGGAPLYVKNSDYTTEINKNGYVVVKFKPEFTEYYGASKFVTVIKCDNEELSLPRMKDRIRNQVRYNFKERIISYLKQLEEKEDFFNGSFDFDDFPDFEEDKKSQSNSTENTDSLDEFDFEVESNKLDELTADEFEFEDFLSSPTLPTAKVTEYFESLFETQIEPSNPILYYIAEASKKLKHLMRERELQQKISNKEKEIEDLKSLLNENKKSIELTDEIIREIKKDL